MNPIDFKNALQPSPFHSRVEAMSQVKSWSGWNGYQSARVYDALAAEYFAIRSSCSVMDLTPMEKYRISGPDAAAFLQRLVTRDISALKPGRVTYVVWCNDDGKMIDDGTIFHLGDAGYRLCAQHHQLDWLLISSLGFDVSIEEETHDVAALSVQGPTSCAVLTAAGIDGLQLLKPFGILDTELQGFPITISRTGFTGDLGYELWADPKNAVAMWDAVFAVDDRGDYNIRPIGLEALEMVRIEAGFILPGDDFVTAESAVRPGRSRSPYELGLGWVVNLDKPHFTGKRALQEEKARPIKRRLLKMSVAGNKLPTDSFLYDSREGRRIGTIKASIWSPILKANLAYGDVEYSKGERPAEIWAEIFYQKELEWRATWAECTVSVQPFWTDERKSLTPPAGF